MSWEGPCEFLKFSSHSPMSYGAYRKISLGEMCKRPEYSITLQDENQRIVVLLSSIQWTVYYNIKGSILMTTTSGNSSRSLQSWNLYIYIYMYIYTKILTYRQQQLKVQLHFVVSDRNPVWWIMNTQLPRAQIVLMTIPLYLTQLHLRNLLHRHFIVSLLQLPEPKHLR